MSSSTLNPPPVPRRHPSRPQLRGSSNTSVDSASSSSTSLSVSPGLPSSRPLSAIYVGPANASDTGSASSKLSLGIAFAGAVGLGSPKLDFKDWAKAGRPDELERPAKSAARALIDDVSGLPSPPGTDVAKAADPPAISPNMLSSESTPTIAAEATPVNRRPRPTLSPVRGPSEDRLAPGPSPSHSSTSSELINVGASAVSRRLSTDLSRIMSGDVVGSPHASSPSHSRRSSRHASPDKLSPSKRLSPTKLRRRRSPGSTQSSPRRCATMPDVLPERQRSGGDDLDDKIRAAEEKIANYTPGARRHEASRGTPSRRQRHELPSDIERSGGSSGSGQRKPLPESFRNGALYTPSPKLSQASDLPLESTHSVRIQRYDTSLESPSRSRYSTLRQQGNHEAISSSRSYRRIEGLERGSTAGAGEYMSPNRHATFDSMSGLPQSRRDHPDSLQQESRLRRSRPESVLGTPGEQYRYRQSAAPLDRDLSGLRIGLAPSDSISAVGAKDGKRDPLEVIRRLEEQRSQHNRRWEHERSESVIGSVRPSSRLDRMPQYPRPTTSMSSMRDLHASPSHTGLYDTVSRRGQQEGSVMDSPLGGRGSRVSVLASEPRFMRSSTSLGRQSAGSVHEPLPQPSTDHGRIMVEALHSLQVRLPDSDLSRALQATATTSNHVSTTVRMASGIAADLAVGLELDDPAKLREQATKLTLVLRDAGRATDRNVRDLTQAFLALSRHLVAVGPAPAPNSQVHTPTSGSFRTPRRSDSSADGSRHGSHHHASDFGPRWSLDLGSPKAESFRERERPATSVGGVYSPSSRHVSQFGSMSALHHQAYSSSMHTPNHTQSHSGLERASSVSYGSASSRRHYEPPLHTIEASPTRPPGHSPAGFSPAFPAVPPREPREPREPRDRRDRRERDREREREHDLRDDLRATRLTRSSDPPRPPRAPERSLRHKASTVSNHTVRASAQPPSPTSASGRAHTPPASAHAYAHTPSTSSPASHARSHAHSHSSSSVSPASASSFLPHLAARATTAVSQVFGEAQVSPSSLAGGGGGRGAYDDGPPSAERARDGSATGTPGERTRYNAGARFDSPRARLGRDLSAEASTNASSPRYANRQDSASGGGDDEALGRRLSVTDRFRQHLRTQREGVA
ncbi:hypothetical protein Q5752_000420 [Cryptotrichosporon argae]